MKKKVKKIKFYKSFFNVFLSELILDNVNANVDYAIKTDLDVDMFTFNADVIILNFKKFY